MPNVEILIPTRNAPEVLWLTLTHLWASGDELVTSQVTLIDNRSTAPGMEAVLGEAIRRGCRVVRNEQNVGVWASVNRGLALARSPRVFVLTADVLLAPGTLAKLGYVLDQAPANLVHLGPWVADWDGLVGLQGAPALATTATTATVQAGQYNGAAWLMRWDTCRERVGWFDPNFYICGGDVDYAERLKLAGLAHGVVQELKCVHLDRQTRRREGTAGQDTEMEIRDLTYFHKKWRDHPEVLARHPIPDRDQWTAFKQGWQGAIVQ